jgi:ABC-type multidrug transport system fused ATPase/permease subunit
MAEANGTQKKEKPKVSLATVRREAGALIWAHRGPLAIGFVLMIVNRLSGFVLPATTKFVIDDVIGQGRGELLPVLALIGGAATLVQALTSFGLSQVVSVAAQRAITEMRESVQAHVMRLPVGYFDSTKSGVLISRIMNDPEGIRNLVGTGIVQLVGGFITASIALVWLLALNWRMTLGTMSLLLLFAAVMGYAFKRLRPIFRARGEITADVTGRLAEGLGGVRLVKVYTAEPHEERVFSGGVRRLLANISSTITGTSAVTAFSTVVVGGIGVLIILMGGSAVLAGTMTLGELIFYVLLIGMMVAPLVQISGIGTQITEAFAGLDRIREIRDVATEYESDEGRRPVEHVEGTVAFEDVGFEYEAGKPVLTDVAFEAPAGTTTALVGPSGSGKSTTIGLIMAFYRPKQGRILIDGRDLEMLRLRDYRSQLGVVLQDNFLFDGTIRDNIAYARPDATDEEVREAGRVANCDEFVDRFEAGYDTIVGERGVKLSGGQRQRVAIARAVLADPRVLILDEATSSLDSESEALIRDGLRRLRRGRTTFVIAHRLSTIQSADQILVLDQGRIVERGTHVELLRAGGLYRRLYEKQKMVEEDLFLNPGEVPAGEPVPDPRSGIEQIIARTGRRL